MAKQLVNPLERHVEKAILGVTGLALIGSIALYLVRTPNRTELSGEAVGPGSIDAKIAAKAVEAVGRLRSAPVKTTIPDPLFETFSGSLNPIKTQALPLVVALGPDVPFIDAGGAVGGPAKLVKVQTPAKPVVVHGRGTFISVDGAGQTVFVPNDWASVSAVWNVKEQREAQMREYGPTQPELILAPAQIQRRMQAADGGWSDADWKDVEAFPVVKLPKEPVIRLTRDGKQVEVDRDTLKEIEKYRSDLIQSSIQLDSLRPRPPEMAQPTTWRVPKITTYREVMLQDDEYLFPNEPASNDPGDRYGLNDEGAAKATTKQLSPAEQVTKSIADGEALLEAAKKNKSKSDAIRAFNLFFEATQSRFASAGDKSRAEKLKSTAEQAVKDIERELVTGGAGVKPGAQPDQADPNAKPKREKRPTQQVWVHDAAMGGLRNGATYQYRMRFRLFNVLAGAPHKFEKPEDAAVLLISSEWSEPSDPITIVPAMEFFVTGEDPKDKEISVEVFRWYLGVWVKSKTKIKAGIGQSVADRQRVEAPALDNPNKADTPEVEFDVGETVVDVDLDRPIRERRAGAAAGGVKFGPAAPSTAAVLVDSQGKLTERWVPVDKNHPKKKETNVLVWAAPKK